jgi:hypothetical protein
MSKIENCTDCPHHRVDPDDLDLCSHPQGLGEVDAEAFPLWCPIGHGPLPDWPPTVGVVLATPKAEKGYGFVWRCDLEGWWHCKNLRPVRACDALEAATVTRLYDSGRLDQIGWWVR